MLMESSTVTNCSPVAWMSRSLRSWDGPDGTPVSDTIPRIGTRITLSGHPFVYGVRAIRTPDGPRLWSCISTRWSTMFRSP
jgi:hypothetical protein